MMSDVILCYHYKHTTQTLNFEPDLKVSVACPECPGPASGVTSAPGSQWRSSYGDPHAVSVGTWRLEAHLGHCPYSGVQKMCSRLSNF